MKIFLTGMSGVGKTSLGKILAQKIDYDFIDIDQLIESKTHMKIADIFSQQGEPYFRTLESEILHQIIKDTKDVVVATGGGLIINPDNYTTMKNNGIIICLIREAEDIWSNIDLDNRPVLKNNGYENYLKLYTTRMPLYLERCTVSFSGTWEQLQKDMYTYYTSILDKEDIL